MMRTQGPWFKDEENRTWMLRGVNLGGSTKVPFTPNGATWNAENFYETKNVSFVGRPFPLEEADEHFSRLKSWGFSFLRFLVTWEAIEHEGPGCYDEAYLDYLYAVVKKAGEYGFSLFIDPHQDVWSRFTGGDGAPGWLFDQIGMDVTKFAETGAALLHQVEGEAYPRMYWPTNDYKYAAATMSALFFAGDDLAPLKKIDGEPVQQYFQKHFFNSMRQVVKRLKGLTNVVGYDTFNEPNNGFIGAPDLRMKFGALHVGVFPTPWQAIQLASGFPQEVDVMVRDVFGEHVTGKKWVNPSRTTLWKKDHQCVWLEHGVWRVDDNGQPELLRPDYFAQTGGHAIDFHQDYLMPFARKYTEMVRAEDVKKIIFIEQVPGNPSPLVEPGELGELVYAGHWYDDMTLFLKQNINFMNYDVLHDKLLFGKKQIRQTFAGLLRSIRQQAIERMGNIPTILGEIGIPYDLNGKKAYRTGNFSAQEKAFERTFKALEDNLLSYTLWNYTADNNNRYGDLWNNEDLSIFSRDQQKDPSDLNSGGRALKVVIRPFPIKTAGEPTRQEFDPASGHFLYEFTGDPTVSAPTEIYFPSYHYGEKSRVVVSDGSFTLDRNEQRLFYTPGALAHHRIEIYKK